MHFTATMYSSLFLLVTIASSVSSKKCDPIASFKHLQQYSPCAHRTEHGVFIGYGYNINLPHARNDLVMIGVERNDISKKIITQGNSQCDCERSVCLTPKQSQWLFDINSDRAQKQVSSLIKSSSRMCCDMQAALVELFFTFGTKYLMTIPDFIFDTNNQNWEKVRSELLVIKWCKVSNRCEILADKIGKGCENVMKENLGCSPPTPKPCDATGSYCCATNNTCCSYRVTEKQKLSNNAYWCCPLSGGTCCSSNNSCCPREYPVCCGGTNSCCYVEYPVCCFPGTSQAYCCAASSPVCLGGQHCGSLNPEIHPVKGK